MSEKTIIEARGLTKFYSDGTCALDQINLSISDGEWVSIMGPSGSGKTTLLNIISCLDKPSDGVLAVDGTDVTQLTEIELTRFRRETIGLIFQQFYLVPYLTALENVMLAQYFHSIVDETDARKALEKVGLGDRLDHLPSQLSGGEQQRVCIARALINQPKMILADEPTGNLDKANEDIVIDLLRHMRAEGRTIVMVTHDPEVGAVADRLVKLDHGKIVLTMSNGPEKQAAARFVTVGP
ncbi:MAG: ABC transporter ATP-binding protein [Chloroflexi bacterium]|nr:ABC transporter ATP-binding protein [Chloroflexota bacterium]